MTELQQYREEAERHDMCVEYREKWDNCKNRKQMIDMALGVKAVDFLCDSIAKGWGIRPHVIRERFEPYINGRYVSHQKGYASRIYCDFMGSITIDTALTALVCCNVNIYVPTYRSCEVYCTGRCNIEVSGKGSIVFVCYGRPSDIVIVGNCGSMKRVDKENCDSNGK